MGAVEHRPSRTSIFTKRVGNFIRLSIEHIARTTSDDRKAWWLELTKEAIAPFVKDRGFNWEFHIDETPFDFWSVQGYRPPPADSDDEKRWAREIGRRHEHTPDLVPSTDRSAVRKRSGRNSASSGNYTATVPV